MTVFRDGMWDLFIQNCHKYKRVNTDEQKIVYIFFFNILCLYAMNIPLRRSRLSGKMETTCPDRRKPL